MFALLFALFVQGAHADMHAVNEAIWDTKAHQWLTLDQLSANIASGDIVVFGEDHAVKGNEDQPETFIHHANQARLIERLTRQFALSSTTVSVGMEFLTYTFQDAVDQFLAGTLCESDFLKAVDWGGNPFQFYRRQILDPQNSGGRTVALNIPSAIAAQVAKGGPTSLSDDDRKLLPPVWERGNDGYHERFLEAMGGHATTGQIENYFWAQSLWDDTMAWRALEHRRQNPDDVLVIIVGAFHVQFDGGLPFELRALGRSRVRTVLQISTADWNPATLNAAVAKNAKYGEQAEFLWVHSGITPIHLDKSSR